MARLFYTGFLYLITPLILLRLLWRSQRAPEYARRWRERFGYVPVPGFDIWSVAPIIWVHSVSVGETLAAVPLVRSLQKKYPDAALIVTTTTPTGSEQVRRLLGDSVYHVYAPYDLPDVLARFFSRLQPSLLIIMETELWPNLLHLCRIRGVPAVLANGRMSEKSARGYRKIAWLTRPMLTDINLVAAQTVADGNRFLDLGLDSARLVVTGNIKFDLTIDSSLRAKALALRSQWRGAPDKFSETAGEGENRPIFLAASTHRGEEEQIIAAFAAILESLPSTLLVIVPRHPERFDDVANLCVKNGFTVVRRSDKREYITGTTQVLLGDTMGELLAFYGACDISFIGGSLVPVGGHNLIEAAAWGVPILTGPQLFNFVEVAEKLTSAGALVVCDDAVQIATAVTRLLNNPGEYQQMASAAQQVASINRGAQLKLMNCLAPLLG